MKPIFPSQIRASLEKRGIKFDTDKAGNVIAASNEVVASTSDMWANLEGFISAVLADCGEQAPFHGMIVTAKDGKFIVTARVNNERRTYELQNGKVLSSKTSEVIAFFEERIKGWTVEVNTKTSRGADPTRMLFVTLTKGSDKIKLEEFQGLVSIKTTEGLPKPPKDVIPICKFAGEDRTKDLDKWLSDNGAPTWTEVMKQYDKYQDELSADPMGGPGSYI